jgi:hypothetical protein
MWQSLSAYEHGIGTATLFIAINDYESTIYETCTANVGNTVGSFGNSAVGQLRGKVIGGKRTV